MSRIPLVLAVSDGRGRSPAAWTGWCSALAAAGVDGLQIREKSLDDRELLELATRARAAFPPPGLLLINGRLDVASLAGADGVHLPADAVPARAARAVAGPGLLLGRSTHTEAEVETLAREGAVDFAIFGPVFPTPDKRDRIEPRGLARLAAACAAGLPVIAVGGLDAARAAAALEAGAAGVAAIRACADEAGASALVAAARTARRRPA